MLVRTHRYGAAVRRERQAVCAECAEALDVFHHELFVGHDGIGTAFATWAPPMRLSGAQSAAAAARNCRSWDANRARNKIMHFQLGLCLLARWAQRARSSSACAAGGHWVNSCHVRRACAHAQADENATDRRPAHAPADWGKPQARAAACRQAQLDARAPSSRTRPRAPQPGRVARTPGAPAPAARPTR